MFNLPNMLSRMTTVPKHVPSYYHVDPWQCWRVKRNQNVFFGHYRLGRVPSCTRRITDLVFCVRKLLWVMPPLKSMRHCLFMWEVRRQLMWLRTFSVIIWYMHPSNERRYIVMSSLIGWAHTQNDPHILPWSLFSWMDIVLSVSLWPYRNWPPS